MSCQGAFGGFPVFARGGLNRVHRTTRTLLAEEPHPERMAGTPGPAIPPPPAMDSETSRAIRFAVYLTGGLVTLAWGIMIITESLGEVLNCLSQDDFCSGGFSQPVYFETVPILVGGAILVVVAFVLLVLARRVDHISVVP